MEAICLKEVEAVGVKETKCVGNKKNMAKKECWGTLKFGAGGNVAEEK